MIKRNWWWICLVAAVALFGLSNVLRNAEAQDGTAAGENGRTEAGAAKPTPAKEKAEAEPADAQGPAEAGKGDATEGTAGAEEAKEDAVADRLETFRTKEESYAGKIVVIPIEEDNLVIAARFKFMQRTLERAEEEGATAVILDMNTPGGLAWASGQLIMNYLPKMTIPTYTYVNPYAVSAGAIIALGTDVIYMAPTSAIGAALAVTGSGGDLNETMDKKIKSISKAQVRSVAKSKGHNIAIAEGFVDDSVEVVIEVDEAESDDFPMGVIVLAKKGEVLSLDHEQATRIINGKPLFAKGIAKDLEDLVAKEGLKGEMVKAKPLGMEAFAEWVGRLAGVLLMLGIAGAYMEMQAPGFGIPGAVSIVCFGIFFFGHYIAGNLAGFEVVAIFALGLLLIAVELLLLPGTIVFGLVGSVLMLGALVYTMAGTPIEGDGGGGAFSINMHGLGAALRNLAMGLVGSIILVAVLLRYLPETRAMSWLVLKTSAAGGGSIDMDVSGMGERTAESGDDIAGLVGQRGVTVTALRPAGKGKFGSRTLDVVSDSEFVDAGVEVKIIEHRGSRIVVAAV